MQAGGTVDWYKPPNQQSSAEGYAKAGSGLLNAYQGGQQYAGSPVVPNQPQGSTVAGAAPDYNAGRKEGAAMGAATGALAGVGSAAALGAALGTAVGPVGTIAGATLGAGIGLFGSLRKSNKNKAAAKSQYQASVKQAEDNYTANARNRYATQYSQNMGCGGSMKKGYMEGGSFSTALMNKIGSAKKV